MSDSNLNDASFTPEINDSEESTNKQTYSATGSFRFWCQKVLPLVYDDSLSYYELLCKVVNYLNNVIQNVDNLNTSVDNTNTAFNNLQNYVNTTKDSLVEAYAELEQYVNDYFNNLNVQDEINSKLDSMAEDGSLSNIISPFIPSIVTNWLSENITPTSPAVDASLSISGAAADAKATGDVKRGLSDVGMWEGKYLVLTEVKNENTVLSFPVNIGTSIYKRTLKITDGGEGGYYGYALLKNQTQVWGIGTPESGLLYVEAGTTVELVIPNDIEADTLTFRNRNSRTGTMIEISVSGIEYPDYVTHQSIYHYLRRIGIKPVIVNVMYGSGGATVDSTTKTITIPSGNTGYNSGFAICFSRSEIKKVAYADNQAVFTLALKASLTIEALKPLMWYASRDLSYTVAKLIGTCENDTYIYEMRFPLASDISDTGEEVVYVQFKNDATLNNTETVQFISGCLEWNSYDQSFIENLRTIRDNSIVFTIDKTLETVDAYNDNNLFRGLVYCYNNNIRNVVVKPGTYDIITEMQEIYGDDWETDITNNSLLSKGIPLSNMDITFESGSFVKCNYTGSNSSFITNFSPFDVSSDTDVTVTGLHLECGNVRYGIHDDVSYKTSPCTHIFKECYVRKSDNNTVWEQPYCLAGGLGTHSRHILKDCDFTCEHTTGGNYNVLYYHNNAAHTGSDGYVRIENMYCSGTFGSVYSGGQVQNVGEPAIMYVHGCRFTKAPVQANADAIVMKAWGNTIE